jgi:hypothetical protein
MCDVTLRAVKLGRPGRVLGSLLLARGVFDRTLKGPWAWRPTRGAGFSSTFPRKAVRRLPSPAALVRRGHPLKRGRPPEGLFQHFAVPLARKLLLYP